MIHNTGFLVAHDVVFNVVSLVGIDDIGVFDFIFQGLPEPPELEGIDEDRLRELQNAVQEQLCQRDEERERNITKSARV